MRVAIQTKSNGQFHNLNFFQANEGFKELGYAIEYFAYELDQMVPWNLSTDTQFIPDKDTIVVGGIPVMNWVYKQLGVDYKGVEDYPKELHRFLHRDVKLTTIGEVRNNIQYDIEHDLINSVFIKPLAPNRKKFTGHVVSRFVDLIRTSGLSDDEVIWSSEVIKPLSEYRVFVHNGDICGMKHYKGVYMTFPNESEIRQMVRAYTTAPIAYAIDVGVVGFVTVLIEVNDATALGCYGLGPVTYAKMIADRWKQLINND